MTTDIMANVKARFLEEHVTIIKNAPVEIVENHEAGKGSAVFDFPGEGIKVVHVNNKPPLSWSKEQKCADGALIELTAEGCNLHIIELKKKINVASWEKIKRQVLGMIYNAKAIAAVAECGNFEKIFCYVCYEEEVLSGTNSANPILLKPLLGVKPSGPAFEWRYSLFDLEDFKNIRVQKVVRPPNGGAGAGTLLT